MTQREKEPGGSLQNEGGLTRLRNDKQDPQARPQPAASSPLFST